MPNHVSQDLWVTGDSTSLKEFQEFGKEDDLILSANKFIPYPTEYSDLDKRAQIERAAGNLSFKNGFNSGGYEWCNKYWGTKWGIYSCILVSEKLNPKKGSLKYTFETAWSPPIPIIRAMSVRYPTLTFKLKYYERGMEYQGIFIIKNGDVITDESSKYRGARGG